MGAETVPLQERLERWAQRLQNLTVSPLTRDYPDNQNQELPKRAIEAFESLKLPNETASAVKNFSGASSEFTVFLTAFVVLVARLTGDEDIAIGTSLGDDGRPFVLRVPIDPSETFLQLYAKVQKVIASAASSVASSDLSRPTMKGPPKSCHWAVYDPIFRRNRNPSERLSSSDSPRTMPLLHRRSTLPILLRQRIWWSMWRPQVPLTERLSWEHTTTSACSPVLGLALS